MNRKQLLKEIKKKGWNIDVDNIDFRRQDATLWYGFDGVPPILVISKEKRSKGKRIIELIATGDIRIYGKRKAHFIFQGGKPDGELTYHLRKNGRWENNNWFEIGEVTIENNHSTSYESCDTVFYTLNDAVQELLSRLN